MLSNWTAQSQILRLNQKSTNVPNVPVPGTATLLILVFASTVTGFPHPTPPKASATPQKCS